MTVGCGFRLSSLHSIIKGAVCNASTALDKLLRTEVDGSAEIRSHLVDSITLMGQAMLKSSHLRKRSMVSDVNPVYKRMCLDEGPVEGKLLYDDLPKVMKEAFVVGRLTGSVGRNSKNSYGPVRSQNRGRGFHSGRGRPYQARQSYRGNSSRQQSRRSRPQ